MKLKEFVENNLEQNSIFRVVAEIPGGHYVLGKNWEETYMNHKVDECPYKNYTFRAITSIGGVGQAINIVVIDENPYSAFINNLRSDEEMQRAYKDNIAMSFKDNYNVNRNLHENANYCAEQFIKMLIK